MPTIHDRPCPICGDLLESDYWTGPDEPEYIGCSRCDMWHEVSDEYPCPMCHGLGEYKGQRCASCEGDGFV